MIPKTRVSFQLGGCFMKFKVGEKVRTARKLETQYVTFEENTILEVIYVDKLMKTYDVLDPTDPTKYITDCNESDFV